MPDIVIAGATFNGVPSIDIPKSGGGTASFFAIDGSQTVTQNGTYDVSALAEMVVNVSGGGGSSRTIIGTFTGTEVGAMDVTIPYTGNGYPITVNIFVTEGIINNHIGRFYYLINSRTTGVCCAVKSEMDTEPTYSSGDGEKNDAVVLTRYKNSNVNTTSFSNSGGKVNFYNNADGEASGTGVAKMKSRTTLSVYIKEESNTYGFMKNIEYTYVITYSS